MAANSNNCPIIRRSNEKRYKHYFLTNWIIQTQAFPSLEYVHRDFERKIITQSNVNLSRVITDWVVTTDWLLPRERPIQSHELRRREVAASGGTRPREKLELESGCLEGKRLILDRDRCSQQLEQLDTEPLMHNREFAV